MFTVCWATMEIAVSPSILHIQDLFIESLNISVSLIVFTSSDRLRSPMFLLGKRKC